VRTCYTKSFVKNSLYCFNAKEKHITILSVLFSFTSIIRPHCWGTGLPYGLHIRRTGHNPVRRPSVGWWVLTTANVAGTNRLTCLSKHGGARDNKFLVTHPMSDQRCLTSAIARRSAWTAGPFIHLKETLAFSLLL
jgi:hypothetical protein